MKVPSGALVLANGSDGNAVVLNEGREAQLNMVIYSGGVIKNHWYWDDLILDLDGVKFPKTKYPILEAHDTERKIAFTEKPIVDSNVRVDPAKTIFVSTPESEQFRTISAQGFPFESSVRMKPLVVERISEDASAKANGIVLKGPGTIIRTWEFVEGSVCVFGYDRNTSSSAFSQRDIVNVEGCEIIKGSLKIWPGTDFKQNIEEEVGEMDMKLLKEKHPDLYNQIQADAKAEAETTFADKEKALKDENVKLTAEKSTLEVKLSEHKTEAETLTDKVLKLERNEIIRSEKEKRTFSEKIAETIWNTKLAPVPAKYHGKMKEIVKASKFIKDQVLDEAAFSAAVDAEIESWGSLFYDSEEVLGYGSSLKGDFPNSEDELAENGVVDELVSMVQ